MTGETRQKPAEGAPDNLKRASMDSVHQNSIDANYVGIVWGVRDGAGPLELATDRTSLAEAELYGDFLTHPRGHYEVWEGWRRLGTAGLAKRGLPILIAWHEYEYFPRGRIVFDTTNHRFTLYADRRLQSPQILVRVLGAFGLDPTRCTIRSDPHYQC